MSLQNIAWAQTDQALDNLIFDPVLLEAGNHAGPASATITGRARYPGLASLAYVAPPTGTVAENPLPDTAEIAGYQRQIADLERVEGLFSPGLIQNLLSLALLYQSQDNHAQAIAAFERADHISRINFGLYNPGQVPIIEGEIDSYLALGDYAAVSDRQNYLMYLNQKLQKIGTGVPGPSLANLGDSNMSILDQALLATDATDNGPQFLFSGLNDTGEAEIARYYAISSLFRARRNYASAISALVEARNYQDPRLPELEYKYLETLFLLGYRNELIENPHYYMTSARIAANKPNRWTYLRRNETGYTAGIESYERILRYLENNPGVADVDRVRTQIELGDWHLLFGWGNAAEEQYGNAFALANELGMDASTIDSLFSPAYPLQLPLFTAKPNSRDKFAIPREEALSYDGWIDMHLLINRNGTARSLKMTVSSANTTHAIELRLKRYLKNSPFRPWIVDGTPVSREVDMRYYYTFR